jgi:hypothetical protein
MYYPKKSSIGAKKAIVALARKMATIIWHLIVNDELYNDNIAKPKVPYETIKVNVPTGYTLDEAFQLLHDALLAIKKPEPALI